MSTGTVLAAVRARLVDRLQARPGLAGVTVNYQPPMSPEDIPRRAVWLDADAVAKVDPRGLGYQAGQVVPLEDWTQTIHLLVSPQDNTDDQATVEADLASMLGEVMDEVCADPSLGLTVDGWDRVTVLVDQWRWLGSPMQVGWIAGVEMDLHVQADRSAQ